MQTFLPSPDFAESARVLDRQRLGKQRVETLQIVKALVTGAGWIHHPVTKMWDGYLPALVEYQFAICREWTEERGYKDTCAGKTLALAGVHPFDAVVLPPFIGNDAFHASHRSNLLRKDPVHYGVFGWTEPDDLPYIYPTLVERA